MYSSEGEIDKIIRKAERPLPSRYKANQETRSIFHYLSDEEESRLFLMGMAENIVSWVATNALIVEEFRKTVLEALKISGYPNDYVDTIRVSFRQFKSMPDEGVLINLWDYTNKDGIHQYAMVGLFYAVVEQGYLCSIMPVHDVKMTAPEEVVARVRTANKDRRELERRETHRRLEDMVASGKFPIA